MAKIVALDPVTHRHTKIIAEQVEESGADLHMVPVVTSEFLKLVVHYPILFSKDAETGQFVCVALTGLQPGENLFWSDAAMQTLYTPLHITRQPFFLGQDDQTGENVICINESHPCVNQISGQALFAEEYGEIVATDTLKQAQGMLSQLLQGEKQTADLINKLLAKNLLTPLRLDITFENGQTSTLQGLYAVDEDKLARLSADDLFELHSESMLQTIYTHIASLGQIYNLIARKNKRNEQPNPWLKAAP